MVDNFPKRFDLAKEILAQNGMVDCHFIRFRPLYKAIASLKPLQHDKNLQILHGLAYDLANVAVCCSKYLKMESQDFNLAYKMWNSEAVLILAKLYKTNYGADTIQNYLEEQKFYSIAVIMKAFALDDPLQIFQEKQKQQIKIQALLEPLPMELNESNLPSQIELNESNLPLQIELNESNLPLTIELNESNDLQNGNKMQSFVQKEENTKAISVDEKPAGDENHVVGGEEIAKLPATHDLKFLGHSPFDKTSGAGHLIIVYIPDYWNEATLKSLFSDYGEVIDTRIIRNLKGYSKGYGFIDFKTLQNAFTAMKALNGKKIDGKSIKVLPAGGCTTANLFVSNIPENWTTLDLGQVFNKFGIISDKRILRKNGKTRYCGFVRFVSEESAKNAQQVLNQHPFMHNGKSVHLQVQPARKYMKKQKMRQNKLLKLPMDGFKEKLPKQIKNQWAVQPMRYLNNQYGMNPGMINNPSSSIQKIPITVAMPVSYSDFTNFSSMASAGRPRITNSMPPMLMYQNNCKRTHATKQNTSHSSRLTRKFDTKQLKTDQPSMIAKFSKKTLEDIFTDPHLFSLLNGYQC